MPPEMALFFRRLREPAAEAPIQEGMAETAGAPSLEPMVAAGLAVGQPLARQERAGPPAADMLLS